MAESYLINRAINLNKCEYGQPYINQNSVSAVTADYYPINSTTSVLSILNKKASGKIIKINNLKVVNNDNPGLINSAPKLVLSGASSISGGTTISATKLNSSNSDVYSGVSVKVGSKSTSGNTIRVLPTTYFYFSLPPYATVPPINFNHGGVGPLGNGKALNSFKSSDTTPIILRNGEGLKLVGLFSGQNMPLSVMIRVSDVAGGGFGDVMYSFDCAVTNDYDIFSIYNGESGQAIKITGIELNFKTAVTSQSGNQGEATALAGIYSVCRISGTVNGTGDSLTPIKLNSTNTLGDTGVEIREFARTQLLNNEGIGAKMLPAIHRISGKYNNTDPSASTLLRVISPSEIRANKFTPIILNEGEGIGVFAELVPFGGIHDLLIEYSIEEVSAPAAGGETGYAYP